jgi:hypothetical protein
MAKTTFTDGLTAVAAAFLNKIFTHVHDGLDQDGSAPKVDLGAHTNLDTGGAAIKAPGHAVAWVTYEVDNSGNLVTIHESFNVSSVTMESSNEVNRIDLTNNVRTDLDGGGNQDDVFAVTVCQSLTKAIFVGARSRKRSDDSEVVYVNYEDDTGAATAPLARIISVVVFGQYP